MHRYEEVVVMVAAMLAFGALPARTQSNNLKPHNVVVHVRSQASAPASAPCDSNTFGTFAAKCPSGTCTSLQYVGGNAQGSMTQGPATSNLCVTFDNGDATGGCTPVYFGGQLVGKEVQTIAGFAAVCDVNKPTLSVLGGYSNDSQSGETGSGAMQGTLDDAKTLNAKLSGFEQAAP
jgi:hypothetical protein